MRLLADATLPGLTQAFPHPFEITLYRQAAEVPALLKGQDILLCRATLPVNEALLKGQSIRYVATASSGTDHIDSHYLNTNGIELIDAKGSNATAVADYAIATLAFLQKFNHFSGRKVAVIGAGEVGTRVAKRFKAAKMEVIYYDPLKEAPHFYSSAFDAIQQCDLISVHANLHDSQPHPSRNLLNEEVLSQLKDNTVIINASRGGIINENALLKLKKSFIYCTDVFQNEPEVNPALVDFATLCTPHIAGHSIEAKYNALAFVSQKLHAFYNLSPPCIQYPEVKQQDKSNIIQSNWQDLILSLYNPIFETIKLKASTNLGSTFLDLRKAHQTRHDFRNYNLQPDNQQILAILGMEKNQE